MGSFQREGRGRASGPRPNPEVRLAEEALRGVPTVAARGRAGGRSSSERRLRFRPKLS